MRKLGLSPKQIIERIWSDYNIRLPPTTAYGWITKRHSPYNGIRLLSLKPSKELAYIIGAVVGDGYVYRYQRRDKHSTEFRIGMNVKDVDFASEFSRCLSEVLKRRPPNPFPTVHGLFTVEVQSKTLYELLKRPFNWRRIRKFVEHCDQCKQAFLRGVFDSEGCVTLYHGVSVCNTDITLIKYVQNLMNTLGIPTSGPYLCRNRGKSFTSPTNGRTYQGKKDYYVLTMSSKANLTYYKKVGFSINRKQRKLEEYLIKRRLMEASS